MSENLDKNGWQDGSTAPQTGEQFLADIGLPWPVVAMYSEADEQFVYAEVECSMFEGRNDPYFVTEREKHENIKRWQPMPELRRVYESTRNAKVVQVSELVYTA